MPDMIQCRLCQNNGFPARAHIEPDGFFRTMKGAKGQLSLVNLDTPKNAETVQTGPWDRTILCQDCETRFAHLDDYGIQFFRDDKFSLVRCTEDFGDVLVAENVEQDRLRRFLLFLAWRIGVSQRPSFKAIDLGERIEHLRKFVLQDKATEPHQFPVVLARHEGAAMVVRGGWNVPVRARDIHLNPCVVEEWGGRRVLQMHLADYVVHMAIDDAQAEGFWATQSLGATLKPVIVAKDYCKRKELEFIKGRLSSKPRERANALH